MNKKESHEQGHSERHLHVVGNRPAYYEDVDKMSPEIFANNIKAGREIRDQLGREALLDTVQTEKGVPVGDIPFIATDSDGKNRIVGYEEADSVYADGSIVNQYGEKVRQSHDERRITDERNKLQNENLGSPVAELSDGQDSESSDAA